MRLSYRLTTSLALAVSFLRLVATEDFCVGGQFRLRIYTKNCEGLSVKTKVGESEPKWTVCGEEDWHSEKDGRDGFPIIGEVPIAREDILEPVTFWFNQGPKDHPYHNETKCTLAFKEDPCVRNLVWKIGWGLDFEGHGEAKSYSFKGEDSMSLVCEGDADFRPPLNPHPKSDDFAA